MNWPHPTPITRAPSRPAASVRPNRPTRPGRLGLLAAMAVLSGCASLDPDAGFAAVQQTARQHLGTELLWARSEADLGQLAQHVDTLLAQPLTADSAVQVALLNNRGLQAALQELGITEAEVVQAAQLPNPGFSLGRSRQADEVERERGLHVDMAHLLSLPWARQQAAPRRAQAQTRLSMALLRLAGDTRKAYYQALAADESLRYTAQVMQAAEASAELARRMEQVGNFSALQRAREQRFHAEAALRFAQAQGAQRSSRERLTRLLGLWGAQTAFRLPERLPDLPKTPLDQPDIEQGAMATRLDVQVARLAAEQTAQQLGLTRQTRFINVLDLGLLQTRSSEAPTQRGWEIRLELPLFDWGQARVARAEAVYMQALHQAAETAINARSEVREAYGNYRLAHDIARHHREELVPLSQRIADENLLRYNGMLIGVFELLADARSQIGSVNSAIEALRDFWITQAELEMALIGPSRQGAIPSGDPSPTLAPAPGAAAH